MTTTIDPTILTTDELIPMLRGWAHGYYPAEAAVELIIRHQTWLHRTDFLLDLVDAVADGWGPEGVTMPIASIDWDRVEHFLAAAPASTSEKAILRFAASLAGALVEPCLREFTGGLDDRNGSLVLDALAHRFGWHERGRAHLVTGAFVSTAVGHG